MLNTDANRDDAPARVAPRGPRRRLATKILLGLLALALLAAGVYTYAAHPAQPTDRAIAALSSDSSVAVEMGRWIEFRPASASPTVGLVIYPGALVEPRSYAPVARAVAAEGYLVAIVPMPLNLAVLAPGRAMEVIQTHPEIQRWAVGGHSLGGSMAATFAREHPNLVQGLVLWASYPAQWDDLSRSMLAVSSIYGANDGLATAAKIEASRALLPAETTWVEIPGGNHAQFGSYGAQSGDSPASIGETEQQTRVALATADLLGRLARSAASAGTPRSGG